MTRKEKSGVSNQPCEGEGRGRRGLADLDQMKDRSMYVHLLTLESSLFYMTNKIEREFVARSVKTEEISMIGFIITLMISPMDRMVLQSYHEVMYVSEHCSLHAWHPKWILLCCHYPSRSLPHSRSVSMIWFVFSNPRPSPCAIVSGDLLTYWHERDLCSCIEEQLHWSLMSDAITGWLRMTLRGSSPMERLLCSRIDADAKYSTSSKKKKQNE